MRAADDTPRPYRLARAFLARLGEIADNSYRFNPMIVTPDDLTGFHGTNEKISIDNLVRATQTYARIIRNGAQLHP